MNDSSGADRFNKLAINEQEGWRQAAGNMAKFAREHAIPIFISQPPSIGGKINGGSGSLIRLNSCTFLVTAYHVLEEYDMRLRAGEAVQWQVGNLFHFDPFTRIAWKDEKGDIVFLRLMSDEVNRIEPRCNISEPVTLGGYRK